MYLHKASVRGTGTFPFDMLRYDRCSPHTSVDVSSMLSPGWVPKGQEPKERIVMLISYTKFKNVNPFQPERWGSFGWNCTKIGDPQKI